MVEVTISNLLYVEISVKIGGKNLMGFGNKNKVKTENTKVKKERVKNVSKYSKTVRLIFLLALVVAVVIGINIVSSRALRETVDIVKVKSGVPQEGIITEDLMYKDTMQKGEYEKQGIVTLSDGSKKRAIVLWDDRAKIINSFASYYIRENTPIYWDAIGKETPKQYSYLYKMDGELLKLNLPANQFGEMLVPGDRINVRAAYQEQVYTLPTESEFMMQQQTGIQPQTTVKRQIKLFNNVAVLDILNSNGESIFDIYYNLLAMPKNQQIKVAATDDFRQSVVPSQILLNVTPEEADMYMNIQSYGPTYMMTLLPRTSSNAITELLNELSTGFAR